MYDLPFDSILTQERCPIKDIRKFTCKGILAKIQNLYGPEYIE